MRNTAASPSWRGRAPPRSRPAYNTAFTQRSSRWSSLGAWSIPAQSGRLLKAESQPSVPSRVCPIAQPATCVHGACLRNRRARVAGSQTHSRYTQWPFWGNVLEGWGSRSKTGNDLVVPAENGRDTQDHQKQNDSSPLDLNTRDFPSRSRWL